ncbi:hypothetical protein [Alphaentomopoxvirus acuprea]|uniref:Uncharacterized protein n=1 Tax=Alphaentomopoxvirus acuprea TaxID=62099 RepID=W6JPN1_9POXV|nr:hypothetical protein BA82_gp209 [Anomala cuprea entomopoxvirus]BAO49569.1 hypothetical protein [Anomala cuprea entomopoxvirus]
MIIMADLLSMSINELSAKLIETSVHDFFKSSYGSIFTNCTDNMREIIIQEENAIQEYNKNVDNNILEIRIKNYNEPGLFEYCMKRKLDIKMKINDDYFVKLLHCYYNDK